MNKKIVFTIFIVLVFFINVKAQTKQEKAVEKAAEQLRVAMIDGNAAKLETLSATNLSYGHSGGHIDDKAEFVKKLAPGGGSDFVTIDITDQTIKITGKTAILRHILKAKTNDGGKPGEVNLRVLQIWQKQAGNWKLLARQAVKIV